MAGETISYLGHRIRARRIDTRERNRWEYLVDGRVCGRAPSERSALVRARACVNTLPKPKYPTLGALRAAVVGGGGHGCVEGVLVIGKDRSQIVSGYDGKLVYDGPGRDRLLAEALTLLGIPHEFV